MHPSLPPTPSFSGLWIPLITPFHDGEVDHPALHTLVRQLSPQGIAGFVACGSTGEAAALTDEEQLAVLDTCITAAEGLPVIMGLSGYHLPHMLERMRAICQRPIAGLLVPAPSYVRPAQDGLLHWFSTLADASNAPLVLYDIPYRTGVKIDIGTLLTLSAHPRIQAIKDCGGDPTKTQMLLADGRLQVLAGEDTQIFTTMSQGGAGAIAASAHRHTRRFAAVIQALAAGELIQARTLWQPLLPWLHALFTEPNPGPLKSLWAHDNGVPAELRPPMTAATPALLHQLLALEKAIPAFET